MVANVLSSEELVTEAQKELGEDEARVQVLLLVKQPLFLVLLFDYQHQQWKNEKLFCEYGDQFFGDYAIGY